MSAPLFSIVMPTRNRSDLLRYALASALEQDFDDFEVILSDNSSDDRTKEVVADFDSPRLRYVRTGAELSMPDSWEFALSHAQGRFITYLCDDDAMTPTLLAKVSDILELDRHPNLVVWSRAAYMHEDWFDPQMRNVVQLQRWTGRIEERDCRERLADLYAIRLDERYPLMLNTMCSRELVDEVREHAGRCFLPPAPDYSFAASAMAATASFLHVDSPVALQGAARQSMIAVMYRKDVMETFMSEFDAREPLSAVPAQVRTAINVLAQSIVYALQVNEELKASGVSLDMPAYFLANYGWLRICESHGLDISHDLEMLQDALSLQAEDVQRSVKRQLRREAFKRPVRRLIGASRLLSAAESQLRPSVRNRQKANTIVDGATHGFSNILECAQRLESMIQEQASIRT